jgi:hypothetical protein
MICTHHPFGRLLLIAALVAPATGQFAYAQDDDELAVNAQAILEGQRQRFRQAVIQKQHAIQLQAQRDLYLAKLDYLLSGRLDELNQYCRLTEAQVKKLNVAGRGDIKRFMDRWDQIAANSHDASAPLDDIRALRLSIRIDAQAKTINGDFFGEASIFSKTLLSTLNQEQAAAYEQALAEKRRLQYQQAVSRAVKSIQKNLVLGNRQVEELVQLLLKETRPPKNFGRASDIALVLFQVSKLPEHTIRPLFDDAQWQALSHWVDAYKNGAGAEQVLKRHGFVFDDDRPINRPPVPERKTEPKNHEG